VRLFGLALPFLETAIGLLLIVGLWTRWTLVAGGLLITALVFGMARRSDWEALSIQMLYAIIYDLLLAARTYGYFALDMLRTKRPGPSTTAPESKCATRPRRTEGLVLTPTRVNRS
jgi:thiosulfate dehydrogenase (quinone) large subunit